MTINVSPEVWVVLVGLLGSAMGGLFLWGSSKSTRESAAVEKYMTAANAVVDMMDGNMRQLRDQAIALTDRLEQCQVGMEQVSELLSKFEVAHASYPECEQCPIDPCPYPSGCIKSSRQIIHDMRKILNGKG